MKGTSARPAIGGYGRAARRIIVALLLLLALPARASGQAPSSDQVNEANNPLTPKITVNLQDQYVASYYGLDDSDSNALLLRGVLPHKLLGWPQIVRAAR